MPLVPETNETPGLPGPPIELKLPWTYGIGTPSPFTTAMLFPQPGYATLYGGPYVLSRLSIGRLLFDNRDSTVGNRAMPNAGRRKPPATHTSVPTTAIELTPPPLTPIPLAPIGSFQ